MTQTANTFPQAAEAAAETAEGTAKATEAGTKGGSDCSPDLGSQCLPAPVESTALTRPPWGTGAAWNRQRPQAKGSDTQ